MVRLMFFVMLFANRNIESSNVVLDEYTPIVGECIYASLMVLIIFIEIVGYRIYNYSFAKLVRVPCKFKE